MIEGEDNKEYNYDDTAQNDQNIPSPGVCMHTEPKIELESACVPFNMQNMIQESQTTRIPHICLVGPSHLDNSLLKEWNTFCKHAAHVRMLHTDTSDAPYILVIDRKGKTITFEDEWLHWILRNAKTRAIYVCAFMDNHTVLESLSQLANGKSALVYDPLCEMSQDALLSNEYGTIIPRSLTHFSEPCVVHRKNEMLHTIKL
jgi:hypothetical protein